MVRYWEDFSAGQTFDLGSYEMTVEQITAFARQWDPQPFHLSEEGGAASVFGGLIASGWHTACVVMLRYVEDLLTDAVSMGSPGLSELRWLAPVRPGDLLRIRAEVVEVRESSVRTDRGTVVLAWEVTNQDGVVVLTMRGRGLFGRRPA